MSVMCATSIRNADCSGVSALSFSNVFRLSLTWPIVDMPLSMTIMFLCVISHLNAQDDTDQPDWAS